MTLKEKQLEFIIYCIENTAERLGAIVRMYIIN